MPAQSPELQALALFRATFGAAPGFLARAPGRVELLGNHTDYNGGLVLAAAVDRFTAVAGRPETGPGREARVRSVNFADDERFGLDALEPGDPGAWGRYVRGVVWAFQESRGPLRGGFAAAVAGDVPLGAGLSSSASLQASLALFLLAAGLAGQGQGADLDDPGRMDLARLLQRG